MKEFTIQEVIEYAQGIEMESFRFYKGAAKILKDPKTAALAERLSMEEEKHCNQLKTLLGAEDTTPEELARKVTLDPSFHEIKIASGSDIPKDATARKILDIALGREKDTERIYGMLLSLTNLNPTMVKMFEDLRGFEKRHVELVSKMIRGVA